MSVRDKAYMKSRFVKGAKPVQQDYIDLIDSYQDTGSSDAFTPIGQALVNSSTQASARSAIGLDFVTTAQAVAGAIATGGMNPVLVKNQIQGFGYTTGAFTTTAAAVAGQADTGYMNPVLTKNAIENLASNNTIPNKGYALARYYHQLGQTPNASAAVISAANRLFFHPYIVGATNTFNRIGINVTSGAGNARLGIYNFANGVPTTLILDCGVVSTATSGEKEATISQQLSAGVYALAVVFDSTPTVTPCENAASIPLFFLGGTTAITNSPELGYMSHTYGALPSTFGSVTYANGGSGAAIWMRNV